MMGDISSNSIMFIKQNFEIDKKWNNFINLMAFLSDADRGLTVVKDPLAHLGPGYYG